ncbi:hypothetical protein DSL72_007562 [Monilinia vaccinii-corymbosi]|uniref:Histidine acid phosphatase n=1 Tax=Monilinia vaccinii-corymbosi TaxID=61207 RepID=A0A8A3PHB5_9HELO|nr:hypothetical protein DSL72_007562 [Monilinia vaccinii-corymbosi]
MPPITWSSVVYTYYGEVTPPLLNTTTTPSRSLTPLGAHQSYNSGSLLRTRYVNASATTTQLTLGLPIHGLADPYILNPQLQVWSTDDEIAGNDQCTAYDIATRSTKISPNATSLVTSTQDFYLSLGDTFFAGIDSSQLNYENAIDLYYYALYQHNHNSSIYNMTNASGLLETLYTFASEQALSFNTPSTGSSIQSISGQTFASKIIQQFQQTISSSGVSDKLSLYFGSYEPMMAFFYLSSLSTSSLTGTRFSMLPEHGSMMAFELFSYVEEGQGDASTTPFPNTDELWVRFVFRNGTSDTDPLISYPLFGLGNSEIDMQYNDFVAELGMFAVNDLSDWCRACASISLFCEAILGNESSGSDAKNFKMLHSKGVNRVVSGVIGAIVTLVVVILFVLFLALLGFRMQCPERNLPNSERNMGVLKRGSSTAGGGFKGPEKLASDTDLNIVKRSGASATARHERGGSWEMGNSPAGRENTTRLDGGRAARGTGGDLGRERVMSTVDYSRRSEDGIGSHDPWGEGVQSEEYV